jgi:hypothetical protein
VLRFPNPGTVSSPSLTTLVIKGDITYITSRLFGPITGDCLLIHITKYTHTQDSILTPSFINLKALQNSGVASAVATTLVSLAESSGTGTVGLLTAVYFATFLISNVVTNNAAAALMFPIAAEAADKAGFPLMAISFIVMLAASASFMSPFGYQTNLMVYGPGGYVFADFLRFGVPMQIVQLVVSVAVIALGSKLWWVSWGATAAAFGATCSFMILEKTPLEYFVSAKNEILKRFGNCTRRGAGRSTDGIDRV